MDFGLGLPTGGAAASPEVISHVATEAERLGLASIWTFERLLRPTRPVSMGGGPAVALPDIYASVYEPIETLAFLAGRTGRIRLGTSVIDALFHPPVVLARRLATLDRLSGGRLVAGLGQGWMPQEFAVTGVPIRRRGAGFQEHIEAMRAIWGADPVSFDGRFYRLPESQIGPKPVRPGGPPLLIGASTVAAAERAARMGIGLNPIAGRPLHPTLEALGDLLGAFRRAAEAAGHDPGALPIVVRVNGSITDAALDDREPLTGSIDQILDDLARLETFGVGEVFWSMRIEPDRQLAAMERLLAATRA
ncbi:MAG TPA: TIGR03619 family F420-dependent LLM class oxidoreductase [Streptosporangiaceae bacterium]|nr:TIGR03619 family F420-dependent LLM class oxidoreductase [Streptosporangiaceae bacterium]